MTLPALGSWPRWITASYASAIGARLCSDADLYESPAVVLCHDRSPDPLLVFTNLAAQTLWERPWVEFVGRPSQITAPVEARAARASALADTHVVRGYSGLRVSASGRRFVITNATVWPVSDDSGILVGQAATFDSWRYLDR